MKAVRTSDPERVDPDASCWPNQSVHCGTSGNPGMRAFRACKTNAGTCYPRRRAHAGTRPSAAHPSGPLHARLGCCRSAYRRIGDRAECMPGCHSDGKRSGRQEPVRCAFRMKGCAPQLRAHLGKSDHTQARDKRRSIASSHPSFVPSPRTALPMFPPCPKDSHLPHLSK